MAVACRTGFGPAAGPSHSFGPSITSFCCPPSSWGASLLVGAALGAGAGAGGAAWIADLLAGAAGLRCGRRCAGVSPAGVVAGKMKAAVAGCFLGSKKKYSDIR